MDADDDEDDKRSVISNATYQLPSSATQPGFETNLSLPLNQSPYAASHLFSRQRDNLNSISEVGWRQNREYDEDQSRPGTPSEGFQSDFNSIRREGNPRHPLLAVTEPIGPRHSNEAAPFRRGIDDEENETGLAGGSPPTSPLEDGLLSQDAGGIRKQPNSISRAKATTAAKGGLPSIAISTLNATASTVPFPTSPPSAREDREEMAKLSARFATSPVQAPGLRSRLPSHMSTSGLSGVLLGDPSDVNGVWRPRSDSFT
jgi:hypothetical protein